MSTLPEPKKRWEITDLAGVTDLATYFEVTQSTISNWIARYEDFPAELCKIGGRKVFSYKQVARWHRETFPPASKSLRHKVKHY